MAKRKFGEKSEALYRVVKFEVKFTREEFYKVLLISDILRELFNSALAERVQVFTEHMAPLYEKLRSLTGKAEEAKEILLDLRAKYKENSITLFDQINALTIKRATDETFASVPRNWQEETLDALDGAYKSFVALRKNGDYDARPPRSRNEGFFQKIPGRFGFKVKEGFLILSCGAGRNLSFPIPGHQLGKLLEAKELKKFELYRDEPDLKKPGRFWISVACESSKPASVAFDPELAVYIALGASSLGIISPKGEEVLPLWRSDKIWVPKINSVDRRMKKRLKNSRGWLKLNSARRRMQVISSRQQLQDEREIVDYLLEKHGCHFVVIDLVIRSKEGKLADRQKPERGGRLGLNWAVQNTGSISRLVLQLQEKVKEHGGSVRRHKLALVERPPGIGSENKIWMARKLKDDFLRTISVPV